MNLVDVDLTDEQHRMALLSHINNAQMMTAQVETYADALDAIGENTTQIRTDIAQAILQIAQLERVAFEFCGGRLN